jgi:hypothetical protein
MNERTRHSRFASEDPSKVTTISSGVIWVRCVSGASLRSNHFVVAGPGPARNFTKWMELILGFRVGVLHRDPRAELNVLQNGRAELVVIRKVRRFKGSHVELDESLPLFLSYVKASVDIDQMHKPKAACEVIRTTEGLDSESSEVIDVFGLAGPEERMQQGILEHAAVESVLEAVQRLLATRKLVKRWHSTILRSQSRSVQSMATCTSLSRRHRTDPDEPVTPCGRLPGVGATMSFPDTHTQKWFEAELKAPARSRRARRRRSPFQCRIAPRRFRS